MKVTTKLGGYADLPGDIRVERFYGGKILGAVTAYDTSGSFIIAVERVSNYEDPSVLAGNVKMPREWPWAKGLTISMVVVDDAQRYLAYKVLERVMDEFTKETK